MYICAPHIVKVLKNATEPNNFFFTSTVYIFDAKREVESFTYFSFKERNYHIYLLACDLKNVFNSLEIVYINYTFIDNNKKKNTENSKTMKIWLEI